MSRSNQKSYLGLALIVVLYLGLAQFYNFAIPMSKGPDELTHYNYALFIAQHARLPITQAERIETGTRAYLPPLYHLPVGLVMALTEKSFPTGTGSAGLYPPLRVTWEPPHRRLIDIVLSRATLIRTQDERPPYWGVYRAWALGRLVSTALGVGTIVLTFLTARQLFPQRPVPALLAAALLALMPTYLFMAAVLNDDNMVGLVMATYILLLVKFLRGDRSVWLLAGMGALIGLGVTTKYNTGLVAIGAAVAIVMVAADWGWSRRDQLRRIGLVWVLVLVSSSWWFIWNIIYFNQVESLGPVAGLLKPFAPDVDPTAYWVVSLFNESVSGPGVAATDVQGNLWDWLHRTFETTWAITVYGVPLYPGYWLIIGGLALLTVVSLVGVGYSFQRGDTFQRRWIFAFVLHFLLVLPLPLIRFFLTYRISDSAQGRHLLYPAAPVMVILLVLGWDYWLKPAAQKATALLGLSALLVWAGWHGWYLWQAYPPALPVRFTPGPQLAVSQAANVNFQNTFLLAGYQAEPLANQSVLRVDLLWQSLAVAPVDYRTELALLDAAGRPALRWLSQPVDGRFPTRAWDVGDSVRDTLHIPLVGLPAGLYRLRLRLLDAAGRPLNASLEKDALLATLDLPSQPEANTVQLWQQGQPYSPPPVYRYRATIPVIAPPQVNILVIDPTGGERQPASTTGSLRLFLIDHTWPSGPYTVRQNNDDTGLSFRVENFDWNFTPPEMMHTLNANFGNDLLLLGYDLPRRRVQAGDGVPLVLYWQSLRQMSRNYIIFDRLLDERGQVWGGYDRIPQETYPTSLWVPGEVVDDGFAVPVNPATPLGIYHIVIGLYDEADPAAESISLLHDGHSTGRTSITIGPIKVGNSPPQAALSPGAVRPQAPLSVDLGELPVIRLRGYDLIRRESSAELTLYWESLAPTDADWSIFAHLRNAAGDTVAQKDGPAGSERYPSSLWDAGEVIADTLELPLAGVPPGQYGLVVGLYKVATGQRLAVPNHPNAELLLTNVEIRP